MRSKGSKIAALVPVAQDDDAPRFDAVDQGVAGTTHCIFACASASTGVPDVWLVGNQTQGFFCSFNYLECYRFARHFGQIGKGGKIIPLSQSRPLKPLCGHGEQ